MKGLLPRDSVLNASFDLHVLGTPPAFILSQDQTLIYKFFPASPTPLFPGVSCLAYCFLGRILVDALVLLEFPRLSRRQLFRIFQGYSTVQLSRSRAVVSCNSSYSLSQPFTFVKHFFQKNNNFIFEKLETEKEGFEPSRRLPDLYP